MVEVPQTETALSLIPCVGQYISTDVRRRPRHYKLEHNRHTFDTHHVIVYSRDISLNSKWPNQLIHLKDVDMFVATVIVV